MNTDTVAIQRCNFDPMEILKEEIPIVEKMVQDECWYQGERVHHPVDPREVEPKIEKIILEAGHEMRKEAIVKIKSKKCINDCTKCNWHVVNNQII